MYATRVCVWKRIKAEQTVTNGPSLLNNPSPLLKNDSNNKPLRRGSSLNTDRFPKRALKAQASIGVRERASPDNFLDFNSLKSPFLSFWVVQTGYWSDFNLESFFMYFYVFLCIMKIWPISVKRWKTAWICRACHWGVIGEIEACVIDVLPLCPLPLVTRSRLKGHLHHPEPTPPREGGHRREVWVELCRQGFQTLTLCKTKIVHFVALFNAI